MDIGIPDVKMFPWIGPNYNAAGYGNRKLLILGESEYEWEKDVLTPEIATHLISANIKGSLRKPFYTKIYHSFSDKPKGQYFELFAAFWNSIAFYNYIQERVGTTPRQRPTWEMWPKWKGTFLLVLEKLDPDCVLILGRELWFNLASLGIIQEDLNTKEIFYLANGIKSIKAAHIPHPASFGFKPAEWRKVTLALLSKDL